MGEVDCPSACPAETLQLKTCLEKYSADVAVYNAQAAKETLSSSPALSEPSMSSCIPTIQAWKDCCEEAKYKGGQRFGDKWNSPPEGQEKKD